MTLCQERGRFIVLEGLDRSGKSTQAATLTQKLIDDGYKTKLIKFPGQFLWSSL